MILKKRTMFSLDQGRASNEALKKPGTKPSASGFVTERRGSGMSELSPKGGSE